MFSTTWQNNFTCEGLVDPLYAVAVKHRNMPYISLEREESRHTCNVGSTSPSFFRFHHDMQCVHTSNPHVVCTHVNLVQRYNHGLIWKCFMVIQIANFSHCQIFPMYIITLYSNSKPPLQTDKGVLVQTGSAFTPPPPRPRSGWY